MKQDFREFQLVKKKARSCFVQMRGRGDGPSLVQATSAAPRVSAEHRLKYLPSGYLVTVLLTVHFCDSYCNLLTVKLWIRASLVAQW